MLHSLIEWAYNEPAWTVNWQPLQPAVIRAEIAAYRAYTQSFSQTQAARVPLSYVVINDYTPVTLDNLDRWYERDTGERLSSFTIYRVRLKQP